MTSEGTSTFFHPNLPVTLVVLFLALCCLVGALMRLNRSESVIPLAAPILVIYWAVWTIVFGLFGAGTYGWPVAVTLAAVAVGATLCVIYFVARNFRFGLTPVGTLVLTMVEIVGLATAGTVLLPVLLMTLVVALGIDGP